MVCFFTCCDLTWPQGHVTWGTGGASWRKLVGQNSEICSFVVLSNIHNQAFATSVNLPNWTYCGLTIVMKPNANTFPQNLAWQWRKLVRQSSKLMGRPPHQLYRKLHPWPEVKLWSWHFLVIYLTCYANKIETLMKTLISGIIGFLSSPPTARFCRKTLAQLGVKHEGGRSPFVSSRMAKWPVPVTVNALLYGYHNPEKGSFSS